ncbi:unnamed protein product [Linum tenue]|uniref:KIB1-4 beta-propeller domain-containing protein n=1 Tax=Linum tenue TaxID=586396 RepID=A0AAV0P0G4_9ROSI|nr:unnamed protein product [Linum tenue]
MLNEDGAREETSTTTTTTVGRPWIVLSHEEKGGGREVVTLVDLAKGVYYSREKNSIEARLRGKRVYAQGHGRVLLMNLDEAAAEAGDCVLLNVTSMVFHQLPPWQKRVNFIYRCSLLHLPDDADSKLTVMVFGVDEDEEENQHAVAMLCQVGDNEWTVCEGGVRVVGAIACQGKLYGIGFPNRFVEIEVRPKYRVRRIPDVDVPSYYIKGCFTRNYLVESCGEILFFYLHVAGNLLKNRHVNVIVDLKAYRIDVEKMKLEAVDDLGDRAFFLSSSDKCFVGSGGFGCCASKSGFERNTIYLVNQSDSCLYAYDYGDESVSITLSCPAVETCSMQRLVVS